MLVCRNRGGELYLVTDLHPLALQQLHPLLQDGEVVGADIARQRLPQHRQVGQVLRPAVKRALQVLQERTTSLNESSRFHWGLG